MNEAKRLCELAQFCRRVAYDQQDPNVSDVLHDLEWDIIEKAKVWERKNRHSLFFSNGGAVRHAAI